MKTVLRGERMKCKKSRASKWRSPRKSRYREAIVVETLNNHSGEVSKQKYVPTPNHRLSESDRVKRTLGK